MSRPEQPKNSTQVIMDNNAFSKRITPEDALLNPELRAKALQQMQQNQQHVKHRQQMAQQQQQQQQRLQQMQRQHQLQHAQSSLPKSHLQGQFDRQRDLLGSAHYDDLPISEVEDLGATGRSLITAFKAVCLDGSLAAVQDFVTSAARTPVFLHHGLCSAISAGNMETVRYLFSAGAPVAAGTPRYAIQPGPRPVSSRIAPAELHLALFELFGQYGWSPKSPEGTLLLPMVVNNLPLLRWLLEHGADPNLAAQVVYRDMSGPEKVSCAALEAAASRGSVESVTILLDAGAEMRNGVPLHYAARACPPGTNPYVARVQPSKEFDESRIPVMALLVQRGADVNQKEERQHLCARYPIVEAVMAGAVGRVKWLLEHGANPELKGAWGSAASCANSSLVTDEMRQVVMDGVKARRWVVDANVDGLGG